MKNRLYRGLLLMVACLLSGSEVRGSDSIFVLLPGIPGESTDVQHRNWIQATGLQFAAEKSRGAEARFDDLTIAKSVDSASAPLTQDCALGTYIPSATVQVTSASLLVYQIKLDNVWVTSVAQSVDVASGASETVTFRFGKISWTYQTNPMTSWDILYGKIPINVSASGVQNAGNGTMNLTWNVSAGATYNILGSSQVKGPYTLVQSFVGTTLGPTTITVPMTNNLFFFRVQEMP